MLENNNIDSRTARAAGAANGADVYGTFILGRPSCAGDRYDAKQPVAVAIKALQMKNTCGKWNHAYRYILLHHPHLVA